MPGSVSEYTDDFPTKYTPENDGLHSHSTRGLDGSHRIQCDIGLIKGRGTKEHRKSNFSAKRNLYYLLEGIDEHSRNRVIGYINRKTFAYYILNTILNNNQSIFIATPVRKLLLDLAT
ncbi:uncharacterized protein N7484_000517 [Penicillium longicatenatum]|uniref:uncharacterized protein n=1 Tax=Penicillium longicatenatum TaxID=1561947 RepID=UPI0025467F8F|nr:uncharacterized protein N7484_000517 [Penicillium longicatenatum]KAJ5661145.1 hypothetical protein N7484_000517 [Penicillium longicatenatum]